jgi:tetratricopeptide (TPR) repeat protein
MRHALATVAASLLFSSQAGARPAAPLLDLAAAQVNFQGLDLSEAEATKKKPAAKAKATKATKAARKKSAGKKSPEAKSTSPVSPPPPLAPAAPASTEANAPRPSDASAPIAAPGLDLSGETAVPLVISKPAEPPPKKQAPAPLMTFEAVDLSGKSAERQRLDSAIKLFKDEAYPSAALALAEVRRDPKMAELHDEAEYMLGKCLYRMNMYHSSLNHFKTLLAKGPSNKFFRSGLEWLFYIARKTVNEQIILDEVAKYAAQEFPEKFRSEFRYLLARYHFARGKALDEAGQADEAKKSFEEARKLVVLVQRGDPFYSRVKYLEGTLQFREGSFALALESFKEVVRANNPRVNSRADPRLRELAFMQLARTHYGHKQNRYAIYYYDKVATGSDQWLESLFEASWAHFRIGDYERALGNLITLSSPFFKDEYFPEALILKSVIYYENCRYREARAILEEFERTYMPVHSELEKITSQNTDAQRYYDVLADIQKRNRTGGKGATLLLERILKLALTDKGLKQVNDSILEIEAEMDSVAGARDAFRFSDLAKGLNEGLRAERALLMGRAGILAKAKLELELSQLTELLGQALRIRFETTDREKKFLEQQLIAGTARSDVLKSYKYSVAVGNEREYWPYEGEYWRDELGTYQYTLTKGCRGK